MDNVIRHTFSVCPVCLKRLPATIVRRGDACYLEKTCGAHGSFSTVVWRGEPPALEEWGGYTPPKDAGSAPDCPNDCGLCAGHLQKTCCALLEVTDRCNLNCPVCFAESGGDSRDPSVSELSEQFRQLAQMDNTFVHLSGGEPTVRDDLPDVVAAAREAGCTYIQLNTNGLRLARDKGYTKALKEAGLSFVFLQFDGTEDEIYETLRGRPLFAEKRAVIDACSDERLGVTLVPTVVPGVNDHNIGEIVRFGVENSPAVRGIHFQPVSYFGRYPKPPKNEDRITLPEILRAMEEETAGMVKLSDFSPSCCDHPRCGFHGDFVVLPDRLLSLTPKVKGDSCCTPRGDEHLKNRNFVARRWLRGAPSPPPSGAPDYSDMTTFLNRVKSHGFTITSMAFQDAYNLDIERLRRCSLHVYKDGRVIPFCARYLTAAPQCGETL